MADSEANAPNFNTAKVTGKSIFERKRDYWDQRAKGYNELTRIKIDEGWDETLQIIGHFINLDRPMRIIDMGTGPGLYAVMLAMRGHDVTAIDCSERMLERAMANAESMGVKVDFVNADVEDPPLENGKYDMILAHNVVWGLEHPKKAYMRWKELLKPSGSLAIVDGNYYLDLYDNDYKKRMRYMELARKGPEDGLHAKTNVDKVDFNIIKEIAYDLPLSRERRPAWDVAALMGAGMTDIHIKSLDKETFSVLSENGLTELPAYFVICCRVPMGKSPYIDAVNYPLDDSNIEWIAKSVEGNEYRLSEVLKALNDVRRLRIVNALLMGDLNVQQISYISGCSASLTSHNLAILKGAKLVTQKKIGREMVYTLRDRERTQILLEMCEDIISK